MKPINIDFTGQIVKPVDQTIKTFKTYFSTKNYTTNMVGKSLKEIRWNKNTFKTYFSTSSSIKLNLLNYVCSAN